MHKKVFGKKLGRGKKARQALFRELVKALILHDKIVTTKAKAKAVQPDAEKIVTLAKKDGVAAKRAVIKRIGGDAALLEKLFLQIAPASKGRVGGYTRITRLPVRLGDRAQMVRLEWVDAPLEKPKKVAKPKKVTKTKKTTAKKTAKTKKVIKKAKKA